MPPSKTYPDGNVRTASNCVLRDVGLEEAGGKQAMKLSSGMYQRLGIARALIKQPSVLLLDEPTRSIDPAAASHLWRLIRELAHDGITILLATHNFSEAVAVADRIAILQKGDLLAVERARGFSVERLRDFYLDITGEQRSNRMAGRSAGVILDKAAAVLKKDVLTALRYRNGFVIGTVGTAAQLATFYYLARAVGPQFHPEGVPYFLFLFVGTGFCSFLITGMHGFLQTIQESQQSGTLEVLMTTSTPPAVLLSLSAISAFAGGLVQLFLYVGAGMLLFSPCAHVSLAGCAAVFIFSVLISVAIGIFAAGLQISIHKGSAVLWLSGIDCMADGGNAVSGGALPRPVRLLVQLAATDAFSDRHASGAAADFKFSRAAA